MKKFKNVFCILILVLSCTIFCSCNIFDSQNNVIDSNLDNTNYVEIVQDKIAKSNLDTNIADNSTGNNQDENQDNKNSYVSTSEELTENKTLSNLMAAREKIRNFNVYIETKLYDRGYFNSRIYETTNLGSGSIIYINSTTRAVYVLTNYHVITKNNPHTNQDYEYCSYTVETINGNIYSATVVGYSEDEDMAIICFYNSKNESLGVADLETRKDGKIYNDEFVLAVGNPSGVKNIVTYGKFLGVSQINNVNYKVIHHNALINPGNSGGALTDLNGCLLGVNTWGTDGDDEDNYSIPLKKVRLFIQTVQESIACFPTIVNIGE